MFSSPYLNGALWALLLWSPMLLAAVLAAWCKAQRTRRPPPLLAQPTAKDLGVKPRPRPGATASTPRKAIARDPHDRRWEGYEVPTYVRRGRQPAVTSPAEPAEPAPHPARRARTPGTRTRPRRETHRAEDLIGAILG